MRLLLPLLFACGHSSTGSLSDRLASAGYQPQSSEQGVQVLSEGPPGVVLTFRETTEGSVYIETLSIGQLDAQAQPSDVVSRLTQASILNSRPGVGRLGMRPEDGQWVLSTSILSGEPITAELLRSYGEALAIEARAAQPLLTP